jgi:hypothetical protein
VQALHSFCTLVEHGLCLAPAPAFFDGPGILSATELSAQSFRSAFANKKPNGDACGHHHGDSDGYGYLRCAYG